MDNSITLHSDSVLEKFKAAAGLVAQSGLSISISKLIEIMILTELNRLDPKNIAERFNRLVMETLLKVSNQTTEKDKKGSDQSTSFLKLNEEIQ
ncbi:MAG: hypothetical protein K1X66_03550 [Verrucomicrobiae bacterium]|nr:hypothetical protein [Verrucomicrobiae bacterium]